MTNKAVVGVAFGDEGKGRLVDYLADQYEVVVRYQGGNNAGHTVINEYGKFALHLIPSGIFNESTINVMGSGMVIDLESLVNEMEELTSKGVHISPENLKISQRAIICLPFHREQDQLEEARLKDKAYGSTKRGIAPSYGDKYMKKGLQVGYLNYPDFLEEQLKLILDWKNTTFTSTYGQGEISMEETLEWLYKYGEILKPYITDVSSELNKALIQDKSILFEAQLGALRDVDYGIYPYSSSSSPLASYAPVGSGMPSIEIDEVTGVLKAYTTSVGDGPFVGELMGKEGEDLREYGGEYGASTGRARRIAYFDVLSHKYGVQLQGCTDLALTKLDVISFLDEIPVIEAYEIDGQRVEEYPYTPDLYRAKPIYTILPGWKKDISHIREYKELPKEAQHYIEYIEKEMGIPIHYISVGPEREALIIRNEDL